MLRLSKPLNISTSIIVCDGNSITASEQYGGVVWPTQLKSRPVFSEPTCNLYNVAVGGQTTGDMLANVTTRVDVLYNPARPCIVIAWELRNDLWYNNYLTPQQCFDRYVQYCEDRRRLGWKVCSVTTADSSLGGVPQGLVNWQRDRLTQVNNLLRSNWTYCSDVLVDAGRVPTLANADNVVNFPDRLHPTGAACAGFVDLLASALLRLGE